MLAPVSTMAGAWKPAPSGEPMICRFLIKGIKSALLLRKHLRPYDGSNTDLDKYFSELKLSPGD